MTITLFDVAGTDDRFRFSPFCWRAHMSLAHKGLDYTATPWRYMEKDRIAASGQGAVPVIFDGDTVVADSWSIAEYLDKAYPTKQQIIPHDARAATHFIKVWSEQTIAPILMRGVVLSLFDALHPDDQDYWRTTREKRFGMTLEDFALPAEKVQDMLHKASAPIRTTLESYPFLGGTAPTFADYALFGMLQWSRLSAPEVFLRPQTPLSAWFETMLDLYDGLGRTAYSPYLSNTSAIQ